MLARRRHLGTVELRRAVDAAVADEHDVVLVREPARVRELHVRDAGTAFEAEDRDAPASPSARGSASPAARSGASPRSCRFSRHDERAAVGARSCRSRSRSGTGGASAGPACAPHGTETGSAPGRNGGSASPSAPSAMSTRRDDPSGTEGCGLRGVHELSFRGRVACHDATSAAGATVIVAKAASGLVPADDPASYSGRRRPAGAWSTFRP